MWSNIRRVIALTLACVVLIHCVNITISNSIDYGLNEHADSSFHSFITLGDTTLQHAQFLMDNSDGTYTLKLGMYSNIGTFDTNNNYNRSKNGYFTATQAGEYLIELWGADGASGGDSSYSNGGVGGLGGHIYGVVSLDAGDSLYYTLGGNGIQTSTNGSGGGANGSGGSHGEVGTYSTGGGGGYSAIYLMDYAELEGNYLYDNEIHKDISESDRVTKYLMIAGGGGGGGAGNGYSVGETITGTPDGGAGGSVGNNYGDLSGDNYTVQGTFFVGEDGSSSGTSVNYVGHGGTNHPGEVSDTITTMYNVEEPNDWVGSYNSNSEGGAGGSGNMRGGSGGAGFCGGSGGIMTGLLVPTNVGGGGGGSSFVANTVNWNNLPDYATSKLLNTKNNTGGAISIKFLGEPASIYTEYSIDCSISEYFDIVSVETTSGTVSVNDNNLSIENMTLSMNSEENQEFIEVSIVAEPKNEFAGGNNVPLIDSFNFSTSSESKTIDIHDGCGHLNVPLNFDIKAHSYVTNILGQEYSVRSLYTDNYSEIRANLDGDWRFDFIESISQYYVNDSNGALLQSNDIIRATETKSYQVYIVVNTKDNGHAVVGNTNNLKTTISKVATITVFQPNSGELNENLVSYTKGLSYNSTDNTYELTLQVKSSSDTSFINHVNNVRIEYSDSAHEFSATAPADGYYLVQIWGGAGGIGAGNRGGSGGSGGYIQGVVHLNKDDLVTSTIGADGADGGSARNGGHGGNYTSFNINNETILIAGGGGGGGGTGGLLGLFSGGNGESGSTDSYSTSLDYDITQYNGKDGEAGSTTAFGSGGAGGNAGQNFKSSTVSDDASNLGSAAQEIVNSASYSDYTLNDLGGAIYITPVQLDTNAGDAAADIDTALSNYEVNIDISKYFEILEISAVNSDTSNCDSAVDIQEKSIRVYNINPAIEISSSESGDESTTTGKIDFTIKVKLGVEAGFIGGNDVPVLSYDNINNSSGIKISQEDSVITVTKQGENNPNDPNKSDYANVAINYVIDTDGFQTNTISYITGDPAILHSELYSHNNPNNYDWEDDYVVFIHEEDNSIQYTPVEDTIVPVTVGVKPTIETPVKASVGPIADELSVTKNATIEVIYQVFYEMTGIKTSDTPDSEGRYLVYPGENYEVSLSADRGSLLPTQITVFIADAEVDRSLYSYNSRTGAIVIPNDIINGTVRIVANAEELDYYTIYFVYQQAPGASEVIEQFEYEVGATLDNLFSTEYIAQEYEGYTFSWDWGTDEGITDMPARNIWVFGSYDPIDYNLTINYVTEDGEQLADAYSAVLPYGGTFSVESPIIPGYKTDTTFAKGTISGDTVIDIVYTPTSNTLSITYVIKDTSEVYDVYSQKYDVGADYAVETPDIDGYTPDKDIVEGVMTADGITITVYYSPNTYTVTFNPDGGQCNTVTKSVVYNSVYGYDGSRYSALPTPVKVGYKFDGWYLDGTKVDEQTKVLKSYDHELVARWSSLEYKLTIHYTYENNAEAHDDTVEYVGYNTEYRFNSPEIDGYTADKPVVSGVMPAQNIVINVVYYKNEYTVTVNYLFTDGAVAHEKYVGTFLRGTDYSVESPNITGYEADNTQVSGNNIQNDVEYTVYYTPLSYTLTIKYMLEDGVTKVHDDFVSTYEFNEEFYVTSPEYIGYEPSPKIVVGTMGAGDQEITVTYYPGEVPEIISVDIEWGDLDFNADRVNWNPETHTYELYIGVNNPGSNYITVTNNSTVNVHATIEANIDGGYSQTFTSYVTHTNSPTDKNRLTSIEKTLDTDFNKSIKTWIWVDEAVDNLLLDNWERLVGSYDIGKCIVTISADNESNIEG